MSTERPTPALRVTAAEFNAARAKAGGDLRKIQPEAEFGSAKPNKLAGGEKNATRNPTWPWLPPGQAANDPSLYKIITTPYGTARATPFTKYGVSIQLGVELGSLVQGEGDQVLANLVLAPSSARLLAAQLLQAAHEAEK